MLPNPAVDPLPYVLGQPSRVVAGNADHEEAVILVDVSSDLRGDLLGGKIPVNKPCGFEIVPPCSACLDRVVDAGIVLTRPIQAFMQFESLGMAILVSLTSLVIATFVSFFVLTWMTGKMAQLNAVAVFIALLFWGWLWGPWGLLLAIPMLGIVKAVSEHIIELQPLAEMLRK